jgi:peptidoglycan/xylan/chitin deacetylase (PgdA/CDA1 family)
VAAPLLALLIWRWWPAAAVGIVALSHALVLYPTLRPNVQWLGPVITCFEAGKPELWLTIDDGPTADTPAVLDLFDRKRVIATFFVKGALARQNPDLVREMIARGHSVANHSQTHPSAWFWCLPPNRVKREIDDCSATLEALTREKQVWFRAPVGMKNPAVHAVLKRRSLKLIGWSVRGFDAVISDPAEVSRRIIPRLHPGAIIVLHQGRDYSLAVLERVIDDAKAAGYRFVVPEDRRLKTKR